MVISSIIYDDVSAWSIIIKIQRDSKNMGVMVVVIEVFLIIKIVVNNIVNEVDVKVRVEHDEVSIFPDIMNPIVSTKVQIGDDREVGN